MRFFSSDKRCIVTGKVGVDLHHVKSRGSGGGNEVFNLMPISHELHVEVHKIGLAKFAEKYPEVTGWLKSNGWEYCDLRARWFRASF